MSGRDRSLLLGVTLRLLLAALAASTTTIALATTPQSPGAAGLAGQTRSTSIAGEHTTTAKPDPGLARLAVSPEQAAAARKSAISAVKSWGYQLNGLDVEATIAAPHDLLVVDATTGLTADRHFTAQEVARLRTKPDGSRRLVVSYLSIGEAEDYRPEYFSREYLEEDAPDWLMGENPRWKGNRLIRFCSEGWQRTILGDDDGRTLYNATEPSPLNRLIELGFDGVYLDRVDAYSEVAEQCPQARETMIRFVERLAAHARRFKPGFLVILQNAEELLADARMVRTIDAAAKEDLFYGQDHTEAANPARTVAESIANLRRAKAAGRPVLVVDYVSDKAKVADVTAKAAAQGFIAYIAPRDLGSLRMPGVDY